MAKEYNRWAASTIESVNEHDFGDSLEGVQAYKQELDKNDAEVTKNSEDKKAVIQVCYSFRIFTEISRKFRYLLSAGSMGSDARTWSD